MNTDSENLRNRLEPGEKPTLRTIARLSGMAVTTVSRALSDAPDIGAETKKRLRRIADEIGYVPNRAGVRLRTGRTNVISLVVGADSDVLNVTARLLSGLIGGLRDTPFHLVMMPDVPDDRLAALKRIVAGGLADAVILNQTEPRDPRVAYLRKHDFPFVTHGRTDWAAEHAWFDYDNAAFGRVAVERLVARGRREMLLLAPPPAHFYAREMIRGARAAADRLGVVLHLAEDMTSDSDNDRVIAGVAAALRRDPGCDAMISASPNATLAAVSALEAAGRVLGEEFDLFSKETVPFLHLVRAEVLTLSEDVDKAGRFLARAAMAEALRKGTAPMQFLDGPDA